MNIKKTRNRKKMSIEERKNHFWSKIDRSNPNGCWPWIAGRRNKAGYGAFSTGGRKDLKMWLSHRFAWQILNGPIPIGMQVLHSCDNPPCCNPKHLFLGNDAINRADCCSKNRQSKLKGEASGRAKLTEIEVLSIRNRRNTCTHRMLAQEFKISIHQIRNILYRKTWTHI